MRILLSGYYGFANFGDDLLLACIHGIVRKRFSDASVAVLANGASTIEGSPMARHDPGEYLHRIVGSDVQFVDWTHREHFDLIVHGGGGTFFDSGNGPPWRRALNAAIQWIGAPAWRTLRGGFRRMTGRPQRMTADRRIGLGLGVGPYPPGATRLAHEAEVLGSFARIAVRDPASLAWCRRLGLSARTSLFTDLAFATDEWKRDSLPATADGPVTFVVCDGKIGNRELLAVAHDMERGGTRVRLVLLDPVHDHDLRQELAGRFKDVLCWEPQAMDLLEFAWKLGSSSLVVSNRAHGAIVAACFGVPTICIDTDDKLRSVQTMLPASCGLMPTDQISSRLAEEIRTMISRRELLQAAAEADVSANRVKAIEMVQHVFE